MFKPEGVTQILQLSCKLYHAKAATQATSMCTVPQLLPFDTVTFCLKQAAAGFHWVDVVFHFNFSGQQ